MNRRSRLKWRWFRLSHRVWSNPASGRRNPDTIFIVGACVVSGAGQLISNALAPAVADQLGAIVAITWAGLLFIFGIITMYGVFKKNTDSGLLFERAGRYSLGCSAAVYAILVWSQNGTRAIVPSLFTLGFALACLYRAVHITLWVRQQRIINDFSR